MEWYRPAMGMLRKFLRRFFGLNAAAAVSTFLLLATLIFWSLSYYRYLAACYGIPYKCAYDLDGLSGRLILRYEFDVGTNFPNGFDFNGYKIQDQQQWSYLTWNSVEYGAITSLGISRVYMEGSSQAPRNDWEPMPPLRRIKAWYIPFSYLAALLGILPILALCSMRRRHRVARLGLCPKCGYNLCAHRPGGAGLVCPECGTPVVGHGPGLDDGGARNARPN